MSADTIKIACENPHRYGGEIVLSGPDGAGDTRIMVTAHQNGNQVQITGLYADLPSLNVLHEAIGRLLREAGATMRDPQATGSAPVPEALREQRVAAYEAARAWCALNATADEVLALARWFLGEG